MLNQPKLRSIDTTSTVILRIKSLKLENKVLNIPSIWASHHSALNILKDYGIKEAHIVQDVSVDSHRVKQ